VLDQSELGHRIEDDEPSDEEVAGERADNGDALAQEWNEALEREGSLGLSRLVWVRRG
jgi:hypothetical protein